MTLLQISQRYFVLIHHYQKKKKADKQLKRQEKREKKRAEEREMKANLSLPKHKLKAALNEKEPIDPQLESLIGNADEMANRDFNMKEIERQDRMSDKKLKGKRKKKEDRRKKLVGGLQDGFKIDTEDKRFSALYDSQNASYAIDPTDSRFKRTKAMDDILNERRESRKVEDTSSSEKVVMSNTTTDLSSLVESVKRKLPKAIGSSKKKWRRKS